MPTLPSKSTGDAEEQKHTVNNHFNLTRLKRDGSTLLLSPWEEVQNSNLNVKHNHTKKNTTRDLSTLASKSTGDDQEEQHTVKKQ